MIQRMAVNVSYCDKSIIDKHEHMESCRVCMNLNSNIRPLFHITNNNIVERIYFCTGVMFKHQDGYPQHICRVCLRNLSIAHKFKTICLQSEEAFQKHLVNSIKKEVDENDDVKIVNNGEDITQFYDNNGDTLGGDIKSNEIQNVYDNDIGDIDVQSTVLNRSEQSSTADDNEIKTQKRQNNILEPQKKVKVRLKKFKFRKLYCETCEIKFECKKDSDEHRSTVHHENVGWVCEICGKNFVHRASLHTHVRSHRPPQHACSTCDYRTSNKYDLVKHLRIHDADGKLYKCSLCAQAYRTVSNLREHSRRRHERVRRFPCPRDACGKAFHDRSKLNRHIDSHDEVKRHVCDICHSAFTRRCYWKKHLQRQHNIEVPPARPGRQKENFLVEEFPRNQKI